MRPPISAEEWTSSPRRPRSGACASKARELGIDFYWDAELARTPEGFYQVRGGLDYAIAKSLSVAPYADLIWMETASADIHEAQEFAEAIHAEFPDKMLAYNLSPSFNWDSTGMTDDEMRAFPEELGEAGFVFNFITYGGHQIDGVAAEEFSTALLAGRHAGPGAGAAEDPPARVALPHPADPRRWAAPRRRPRGIVGTHRDDEGDGQGLDAGPAPQTDRAAQEGARGLAGRSGRRSTASTSSSRCACSPSREGTDVLELERPRRGRREARRRRVRPDPRPQGPHDPVGPRPEHVRRLAAPQAPA